MRVVQGRLKNLRIPTIPGPHRPFTAKAREWLFYCLGDIIGLDFLDLFAGTGIVSLEAFSAGAYPVSVDRNKRTAVHVRAFLQKNALSWPYITQPAEAFLKQKKRTFDIVFCDPPFAYNYTADLLLQLLNASLLKTNARVIIHTTKKVPITIPNHFLVTKEKEFGFSLVRILEHKGNISHVSTTNNTIT